MEKTSTELVATTTTDISEIANNTHSKHSHGQVVAAISMLDTMYKKNISDYAEKLHTYTREIENQKNQLALLMKEKAPHTTALLNIEKEVDYTLRLLERLTEGWCQKSVVITELDNELSHLNHTSDERKNILRERKQTLEDLKREIEDTELSLLEHELEKQNILLSLEPIERKMMTLEQSIQALESEKRYIEASQLHALSPTMQSGTPALLK